MTNRDDRKILFQLHIQNQFTFKTPKDKQCSKWQKNAKGGEMKQRRFKDREKKYKIGQKHKEEQTERLKKTGKDYGQN